MDPHSTCSGLFAAEPDISGIGVRVAIYTQNLLSFIPAVWALWDGKVTEAELDSIEAQSTSILITAFAILISAIVETRTVGLSSYHAGIVLSLSWMNNTNTFIYFLLYIHHKSLVPEGRIETLAGWIKHVLKNLSIHSPVTEQAPSDSDADVEGKIIW
ncbi:hypothetical protein B0H15DRAFT_957021 [Mycena belliarum]|uniref:Uncharacterized protein n=1 Tax=Mycena belliarum TaxID=1033014 RepID=A0AAD6XEN6_9AGAR|nr:hypothetical protein B0H15DRAFT_957021 [Mycena belliae]